MKNCAAMKGTHGETPAMHVDALPRQARRRLTALADHVDFLYSRSDSAFQRADTLRKRLFTLRSEREARRRLYSRAGGDDNIVKAENEIDAEAQLTALDEARTKAYAAWT